MSRPITLFTGQWADLPFEEVAPIKDLFKSLAAEGRTLFLSTHSLDVAQEVCHRVGILYKGRLVALGTMDELTASADLEEVFLRITEEQSEPSAVRAG